MMHLRGLVLFLLCLAGGARRRMRINSARRDVQQQSNTLANGLEVSAEAGEALIPGFFTRSIYPGAGPQTGALSKEPKYPAARLSEPTVTNPLGLDKLLGGVLAAVAVAAAPPANIAYGYDTIPMAIPQSQQVEKVAAKPRKPASGGYDTIEAALAKAQKAEKGPARPQKPDANAKAEKAAKAAAENAQKAAAKEQAAAIAKAAKAAKAAAKEEEAEKAAAAAKAEKAQKAAAKEEAAAIAKAAKAAKAAANEEEAEKAAAAAKAEKAQKAAAKEEAAAIAKAAKAAKAAANEEEAEKAAAAAKAEKAQKAAAKEEAAAIAKAEKAAKAAAKQEQSDKAAAVAQAEKAQKAAAKQEEAEKAAAAAKAEKAAKAAAKQEKDMTVIAATDGKDAAKSKGVAAKLPSSASPTDVSVALRSGVLKLDPRDLKIPSSIGITLPGVGPLRVDLSAQISKASAEQVANADVVVSLPKDLIKAGKLAASGSAGVALDAPGLASGKFDLDIATPRKGEADVTVTSKLIPKLPLPKTKGLGRFCYECGNGEPDSDWFVARNLGSGVQFYGNAKTGVSQFEVPEGY